MPPSVSSAADSNTHGATRLRVTPAHTSRADAAAATKADVVVYVRRVHRKDANTPKKSSAAKLQTTECRRAARPQRSRQRHSTAADIHSIPS